MRVVDLFCGIGGWTEGARQAGHEPVLAVDSDKLALKAHARNHTCCRHILRILPSEDIPWPRGCAWHLHASPPCQKLSQCNRIVQDSERRRACDLIEWVFDHVEKLHPKSWSFEQVATPQVIRLLSERQHRRPDLYAFAVINCNDYGVPQDRRRLLAGTPHILRAFLGRTTPGCSVLDTIPRPPSSYVMNHTTNTPDRRNGGWRPLQPREHMRHIKRPTYTITTTAQKWVTPEGQLVRPLTPQEAALLQTFPATYFLGESTTAQHRHVGNAVPVEVAYRFMRGL